MAISWKGEMVWWCGDLIPNANVRDHFSLTARGFEERRMTARGLRFSMTRANPKGKGGVKGGGGALALVDLICTRNGTYYSPYNKCWSKLMFEAKNCHS